jgi:transposase
MDWEDRLDEWEVELELSAQLDGSEWVTLERAAVETGVSRAALRTWYRAGQIPSRLVDGPHGPQRLVPLAVVAERAEASPRLRKTAERRLGDEAQLEILRHRIDQLELRLAALERRQPDDDTPLPRQHHRQHQRPHHRQHRHLYQCRHHHQHRQPTHNRRQKRLPISFDHEIRTNRAQKGSEPIRRRESGQK